MYNFLYFSILLAFTIDNWLSTNYLQMIELDDLSVRLFFQAWF